MKEAVAKTGINLLPREEASDTDIPNDTSGEIHATRNEDSKHEDVGLVSWLNKASISTARKCRIYREIIMLVY